MKNRKAILIQCAKEYFAIINPEIDKIVRELGFTTSKASYEDPDRKLDKNEILKWIICEELELIYGLFDISHVHNHTPFSSIHNKLVTHLQFGGGLSKLTTEYIKAPKLYSENNIISVRVTQFDIYIEYNSCKPPLQTELPYLNYQRRI